MGNHSLEFRWTVSRGRDTYGYNICTLYVDGDKVARCNGGGYDMKGTCFGDFIARRYPDRLLALKPAEMDEQSHWERDEGAWICRARDCVANRIKLDLPLIEAHGSDRPECPQCNEPMESDHRAGKRIDDGRYFYGLTFHDPHFDPSKAVIGEGCDDRTLSDREGVGLTVEEAEKKGISLGLERYQAFYRASSKTPTERHTVPQIDGACGMSSVERIAKAIGLELEYVRGRKNRRDDFYMLHDKRQQAAA